MPRLHDDRGQDGLLDAGHRVPALSAHLSDEPQRQAGEHLAEQSVSEALGPIGIQPPTCGFVPKAALWTPERVRGDGAMLNVDRRWDASDPFASIFAGLRGVEGDIAPPMAATSFGTNGVG
jgi:hypothetical protein